MALNTKQELQLKVRDMEGLFFVTGDADIMNVQLNASSSILAITRYFFSTLLLFFSFENKYIYVSYKSTFKMLKIFMKL